jgi:hypothetical protein
MRSRYLALFLALAACGGGESSTAESDLAGRPRSAVELKITVRADEIDLGLSALAVEDADAELREIYFYDTPELALYEAGMILRARVRHGGEDDTTVKLRPLRASQVAKKWFSVKGFKCEIDRVGDVGTEACSLTRPEDADDIDDVAAGQASVKSLFSDQQEELAGRYGEEPDWSELATLGPVDASVWTLEVEELPEDLTVELWTLPDESRILELSMRVDAKEADGAAEALAAFAGDLGLDPSSQEESKTSTTLLFFTR